MDPLYNKAIRPGGICFLILALAIAGCQKSQPEATPESSAWAAVQSYAGNTGISGVIRLDGRLENKFEKTDVLYIIAHAADRAGGSGPPLAAKRIVSPHFPMTYQIGPEDLISERSAFSGRIIVSARLDKDGDAGPLQPGDMTGISRKNPAKVADQGVDIVIDTVN